MDKKVFLSNWPADCLRIAEGGFLREKLDDSVFLHCGFDDGAV